ncbi:hypothetical protein AB0N17_45640, partial [Streptomyces sp. NPDC051133]
MSASDEHTGRKGERRTLFEDDYMSLVDGRHPLVNAPIMLVWDWLKPRVPRTMHELIEAREWLRVFILRSNARLVNTQVVYAAGSNSETGDLLAPLNITSSEGV